MIDVAIVGAGAAGIGAARALAGRGLSIVLIEAAARVGGRAWTERVDGLALDLGCGWLHSGARNPWVGIAEAAGVAVSRTAPAWGRQWRDLGFPPADQAEAAAAREAWERRLRAPVPSDRAADALEPGGRWNASLQALSGFLNGAALERVSVADYLAYDDAAGEENWRVPGGYGRLVAASLPADVPLRLGTAVTALGLAGAGVRIDTEAGTLAARMAILTMSTAVLAGGAIRLPAALDAHVHAAACLPLGLADKIFLALDGAHPFEPETSLLGDPHDPASASFYLRPFGAPVIEAFVGGPGAAALEAAGPAAAAAHAIDRLAVLAGSAVRRALRPIAVTAWRRMDGFGGSYSHALPGHAPARAVLARPLDDRLFFAGEATHPTDFSTCHGALASGIRAAGEVVAALAAG